MKKKYLLSAVFAAFVFIGSAQVPEAFNYQAVVRNSSGEVLASQNVSFRISILQGSASGAVLYAETHTVSTNAFGLANLKIGHGTVVSGTFSPTGWGSTSHFIKVEIDPAGGSSYTHLGTSELLSVPYAFHAQTVQTDNVDDADADPTNEIQTLSLVGSDLTLSEGGGTVTLPEPTGDDWGTQAVESDATLSGDGTSGDPLGVVGDLTDDQTLTLVGNDLSITDGNTVTIPGDDWGTQAVEGDATLSGDGTSGDPLGVVGDLTDDQTLSLAGHDLTISGGNTVTLPGDNWGSQTVVSNATLSGNGTSGSPLGVVGDLSDDQTLSISGDNLSISNGNTVNIGGADNQTLSVSGFNLSISNGNTVAVPTIWNLNGNRVYYNDGAVGIGTSTPNATLDVYRDGNSYLRTNLATGQAYHTLKADGSNTWTAGLSSSYGYTIRVNSNYLFGLSPAGTIELNADMLLFDKTYDYLLSTGRDLYISGNGVVGTLSSSIKYKTNIRPMGDFSSRIFDLSPVLYDAKNGDEKDLVGLIAEDVEKVMPELVSYNKEGEIETVYYHKLVPLLLNEIIKLKAEVDDLRKKLED